MSEVVATHAASCALPGKRRQTLGLAPSTGEWPRALVSRSRAGIKGVVSRRLSPIRRG